MLYIASCFQNSLLFCVFLLLLCYVLEICGPAKDAFRVNVRLIVNLFIYFHFNIEVFLFQKIKVHGTENNKKNILQIKS
jgi:hypothetical protein